MDKRHLPLLVAATLSLAACGGGGNNNGAFFPIAAAPAPAPTPAPAPPPAPAPAPAPEETRIQDTRTFTPSAADASATTFAALKTDASDTVDNTTTSRWSGVLGGALYHVEVPADWNGKLVMYAHGYRGEGSVLTVDDAPGMRRYLIQNGYAWAASSYSKNFYDVRAGVEDTNALALEFNTIAAANGRTLAAPSKVYITGVSMGGHITAAAIEDEAFATAKNKIKYNGAAPMCGVLGDTELFDYFAGAQVTAQVLASVPKYPFANFGDISGLVTSALFTGYPSNPLVPTTPTGVKFQSVVKNLTGGERPIAGQGYLYGGTIPVVFSVFGSDGTVNGILNKSVVDTNRFSYLVDGDASTTTTLNTTSLKITAAADANRLRTDGLRWIPKTNGEFKIPVVTLHTLGDYYVPFSMEQIYQKRVAAKGNTDWLVQRAVRGASHCDFTAAEQSETLDAMLKWEQGGAKPGGDDVVTPATVAAASYGCTYTRNTIGPDDQPLPDGTVAKLRYLIEQTTAPCPTP
ncbi:alpha/beta hydrolase [Variovorax sp. PAMC 28711]|uniref:alpha/beta hydrolase n=1 Tax=Variovorax sp. PAMC 28711 TaxID=1795631 RepID=UPI00078B48FD|nr:alpha/beta hydrolase [Variovorax sp. PAMC 28711]AMM26440.1 alpha/beta hydrolase [Variovorax sp. PAMC 28711]